MLEVHNKFIIFGGAEPADSGKTESWDGTSWTEVADINTARRNLGGAGSSNTSAFGFGGESPAKANAEQWDGSAWTEVGDLNTARLYMGAAGASSSALAYGGSNLVKAILKYWNGSSWTEVNDLSTARYGGLLKALLFLLFLVVDILQQMLQVTEEFTADNTLSTVTVS